MTLTTSDRAELLAWCNEVIAELDDALTDSDAQWRTKHWPSETGDAARALKSLLTSAPVEERVTKKALSCEMKGPVKP